MLKNKILVLFIIGSLPATAGAIAWDFGTPCNLSSNLGIQTCAYSASPTGPMVLAYGGVQYNVSATYNFYPGADLFTRRAQDFGFPNGSTIHYNALTGIKTGDGSSGYREFAYFDLSGLIASNITAVTLRVAPYELNYPSWFNLGSVGFSSTISPSTFNQSGAIITPCAQGLPECSLDLSVTGRYLIVNSGGAGNTLLLTGLTAQSVPEPGTLTANTLGLTSILLYLFLRRRATNLSKAKGFSK